MMRFHGRGILLDIEGTLCPTSYFENVLASHSRRHVTGYLRGHWFDGAVARVRDHIARDNGAASFDKWCKGEPSSAEAFVKLYDAILKQLKLPTPSAAVRELLELTWRDGYKDAGLVTQVYDDVHTALESWIQAGRDVRSFSTVSVAAQCALLTRTQQGNLLGYFCDHYDESNPGPKRAPGSYCSIADDMRMSPHEILYVSDDPAELDAARFADFSTALILRPDNPPPPASSRHPIVRDLRAILVG